MAGRGQDQGHARPPLAEPVWPEAAEAPPGGVGPVELHIIPPGLLDDLYDPDLIIGPGYIGPDRRRTPRRAARHEPDRRSVVRFRPDAPDRPGHDGGRGPADPDGHPPRPARHRCDAAGGPAGGPDPDPREQRPPTGRADPARRDHRTGRHRQDAIPPVARGIGTDRLWPRHRSRETDRLCPSPRGGPSASVGPSPGVAEGATQRAHGTPGRPPAPLHPGPVAKSGVGREGSAATDASRPERFR